MTQLRSSSPPTASRLGAATVAALALLMLPAITACSKNSSSSPQASAQNDAPDPNDAVIARVNGVEIRQSDLALAEDDFGQEMQGAPPEMKREQLIAYMTDVILVAQESEKKGLTANSEFKRRLAFMRNKLLMGALLQEHAKSAATDEEMHKVYEDALKQMGEQEEVRARHILVESEDEAKGIADQLKGGADFAALAKEKSKDPGSAPNGGLLDFMSKNELVPEFAEVAFKMYPGQTSNPVKTQFGWHIIRLEEKRKKQPPTFEQLKDRIEAFVIRKAQAEMVAKLREGAKIERLDKPAAPQAAPPTMMVPGAKQ